MWISRKNLPGHVSPTLFGKKSIEQHPNLVSALAKSLTSAFKEAQERLVVNLYWRGTWLSASLEEEKQYLVVLWTRPTNQSQ